MNISSLFPGLADINFCVKDTETVAQEVISRYEEISGRTLARADPVRLFLNAIILEFVQQRNAIDFAAKMNLLAYSQGEYLDHLGALLGVTRLEASYASCMAKFTLSAALWHSVDIPIGTRITPDGKIFFATTEILRIPACQVEGVCSCVCTEAGSAGNDYPAGSISKLVDQFPYEMKCTNITASSGGTDSEDDEAFRERIRLAPESFTTAGSRKGYEYFALSAVPGIADVKVLTASDDASIQPGNVNIYVLMQNGVIPDDNTLAKVLEACSADDVRPDTDYVHALKPEVVNYSVDVQYWISAENSSVAETIQAQVAEAVASWVEWQGSALGRDINPSRLNHDIIAAGSERCVIISPEFTHLKSSQAAKTVSSINIVYKGLE